MNTRQHYRTIILSDIHLGTPHSRADEVSHFLKHTQCDRLILNGDIIDGWRLRRDGKWTKSHTRCVRQILKKAQKQNTEIIYLRGNHDDVVGRFLPLTFDNLRFDEDFILENKNGRYLVFHGDVFDSVIKNVAILAHLGDIGYAFLLKLNRFYNLWRTWRGKEYFSLSQAIKARVKKAVSYISDFESQVASLARKRGCKGAICGHIHTPADKQIDEVHYLNSGDWVESLTAIVEHHDGRFELITFKQFLELHPMSPGTADSEDASDVAIETHNPARELLPA